ncbi:hypothetical protein CEXT_441571 [Caerostris extrusa]|uniref:Uncharacterized protein n=1 Tax=Caerostris extrusa TaxID=172846 RepID=A0AAV4X9F0_CAEEX|nr:hypothetical protein CEXT_441571 [Caerostris extrusa]
MYSSCQAALVKQRNPKKRQSAGRILCRDEGDICVRRVKRSTREKAASACLRGIHIRMMQGLLHNRSVMGRWLAVASLTSGILSRFCVHLCNREIQGQTTPEARPALV